MPTCKPYVAPIIASEMMGMGAAPVATTTIRYTSWKIC